MDLRSLEMPDEALGEKVVEYESSPAEDAIPETELTW